MNTSNRTARTAGILFLLTFASAIAGAALYAPLLTDPDYLAGPGADTRVLLGAVCELVLIIANIGTAVVLYPVLRRHSDTAALGYVAARIMECALIAVGILSVLTVVTLRQTAGAGAGEYLPVARTLVAVHGWTFLLGPGFVVGIGNGLLLGFLMYRSHLVPRPMALFGLIGGPLMSLSGLAVLFGAYEQSSVPSALATLPEIIWEAFLGIYLTAIGFRRVRAGSGDGTGADGSVAGARARRRSQVAASIAAHSSQAISASMPKVDPLPAAAAATATAPPCWCPPPPPPGASSSTA